MSNTYFQFKQFKIEQDQCAMKVCTDSCLFGAWIPVSENCNTILDIGTGTGLLSLMLAQRVPSSFIDSVEINKQAFLQALNNIKNSPFSHQIRLFHSDIMEYSFDRKYNLIVCNPPFYERQMHSEIPEESTAKHATDLTIAQLFKIVKEALSENGKFALLLPYYRKHEVLDLAEKFKLFPESTISIKSSDKHNFFRFAVLFSQQKQNHQSDEILSIRKDDNSYSKNFIDYLSPFYLNL